MTYNSRNLSNRRKKTTYNSGIIDHRQKRSKSSKKFSFKKLLKYGFLSAVGIFLLGGIIAAIWIKINVLKGLPEVSDIKNMVFSQTTEIQDRNGVVLYKLFEENREFVPYDNISPHMVNALVAMEDQRYREHGGLDPWGILRVVLCRVLPVGKCGGASTLTQQLLKNLLLNPDGNRETMKEKVVRKLREFFLASKLEKTLQEEIKNEMGKLSKEEAHYEMKKQTLELYLNYIFLGNNSYGVEAASTTYFGKSADEITVLQAAILASLPQAPSYYNPYANRSRVMGKLVIAESDGTVISTSSGNQLENLAIDKIKNILTQTDLSNKRENNGFSQFIKGLGSFTISSEGKTYYVNYELGRKDAVLARMYEDGYIDQTELKNAFLQSLDFKFSKPRLEIKAPHFVFRVIEELEKNYDKEMLMNNGLIVKTTLDYEIQKIAEQAILDNKKSLEYYGANNEAMVYIDSTNGDVLAYVGSVDYFDEDIEGQNDMVRRPRQTGSSIKPLIYACGFENLPLTLDTPIYDIPFQIGSLRPNNADGKFLGIMPLKNALAYSRNIPSTKIFLGVGGENIVKPYLRAIGLTSLDENHEYGYSMALGAGEVPMLELANAYMHLSARGKPATINPILEINSPEGAIIYQKEVEMQPEVIKPGIAYLLRSILSDKNNMPPGWVSKYSVSGLLLGVKSGTSNMKTPKGDRARDGWLVGYTPTGVTIFRGGNTDGSAMYSNAYGGFLNADAMTKFRSDLKKNNYVSNQNMGSVEVVQTTISKLSGKIPGEGTPDEFKTVTLAYAYNQPGTVDNGMTAVQVDKLCNGMASPYTPDEDLINGYLIEASSFMPNNMDLNEITQRRKESAVGSGQENPEGINRNKFVTYNYPTVFVSVPEEYCNGRIPKVDQEIGVEIMKPTNKSTVVKSFSVRYRVNGPRYAKKVIIYANDEIIANFDEDLGRDFTRIVNVTVPDELIGKNITLKVEAIDNQGYSNTNSVQLTITNKEDTTPPTLLKNKIQISEENGKYRVLMLFEDDLSGVAGGKIARNGQIISEFEGSLVNFVTDNLNPISVVATDAYENLAKETINLMDYYGYGYTE